MRTGLRARPALLLGCLAVRAIEYDTEAVALLASRLRQPDSLDGLNVALAAYAPGPMTQVKWKVALYLDERADPAQRDALAKIFSGQAGGPPGGLTALIGEVLGVKSAGIEFRVDGKRRGLRIAGVAEADIEALTGQEGKEVTVSNHPLTAVPGFPAVVARSKRASYHDHGLALDGHGQERVLLAVRVPAVAKGAMQAAISFEALLRRDRWVVGAGIAGATALAWAYQIYMAWGMEHGSPLIAALMPRMQAWTAWDALLLFAMWVLMMIAMMLPSVAPTVLAFAEINRRRREERSPFVPTGVFLAGYLAAWVGFSLVATLAQEALHAAALMSPAMMARSPILAGVLLVATGVFQWTPLKQAVDLRLR